MNEHPTLMCLATPQNKKQTNKTNKQIKQKTNKHKNKQNKTKQTKKPCYQEFLSNLYLVGPFNFVSPPAHFFLALGVTNANFRVGPKTKRGHPALRHRQRWL